MRLLITFLLMSIVAQVSAQKADSVKEAYMKGRFAPTGLRIGVDVVSPIRSEVKKGYSGWEVNADVDLYRYLLIVDYGSSATSLSGGGATYENDGKYYRIGAAANFLTRDEDRNVFFLGMSYARSKYDEILITAAEDDTWATDARTYTNTGVAARWLEVNGGLKVKLWPWVWVGYTARYKFGLKYDKSQQLLPHEVPGYGTTDKESTWGFNYYIFLRIPVRKAGSILPPKK